MKKIIEFLQDHKGAFSSTRLLTCIFTVQFLYESHILLQVDKTQYIIFCITVASIILVLVGKMSAENITSIFKGKNDAN
jgi:hypothetical protein